MSSLFRSLLPENNRFARGKLIDNVWVLGLWLSFEQYQCGTNPLMSLHLYLENCYFVCTVTVDWPFSTYICVDTLGPDRQVKQKKIKKKTNESTQIEQVAERWRFWRGGVGIGTEGGDVEPAVLHIYFIPPSLQLFSPSQVISTSHLHNFNNSGRIV